MSDPHSLCSVVFGPELVSLGPEEQFTVLSLSAGRPKRPHARRALCLLLGPDFFTDVITIETADHARLQLQLAYNWYGAGGRWQRLLLEQPPENPEDKRWLLEVLGRR